VKRSCKDTPLTNRQKQSGLSFPSTSTRQQASLWFAGNPDFASESVGKIFVELARDGDPFDLQSVMLVFALRLTGRVVFEHAIVKVDFAGTTFDDDYAAFSWIWV
jgi:hypothetical protein